MDATREVDEFGNVSYSVTVDGKPLGRILKTCSAWQVEPYPFTSYAPVRSVRAGLSWLALYARVMAKSAKDFDNEQSA